MSEVIEMPRTAVAAPSPSDLLRIAVEKGANLDQLERLMGLQERYEANEARKAYTVAMSAFKAEPVQIMKAKTVSFTTRDGDTTSYKHAELSDVTEAIGPAMAKHQLSYRWNVKQDGPAITVDCIITHVLGHSETVTMTAQPDTSGKKNAIQQVASAVTYLQRYTLLAATGMSTKGMDDDGKAPDAALANEWVDQVEAAGTPEALQKVWEAGLTKINAANDLQAFAAFKQAVSDRKKALGGK